MEEKLKRLEEKIELLENYSVVNNKMINDRIDSVIKVIRDLNDSNEDSFIKIQDEIRSINNYL